MKKLGILITMLMVAAVLMAGCAGGPVDLTNNSNSGGNPNFQLLISDEANDIADFTSLNATITKIGLHRSGENADWEEITLDPKVTVNLVDLPGTLAQKIYNGNLISGNYTKVFIYVEKVEGILTPEVAAEVGEFSIKLPSGKFQISKNFEVTQGVMTSFVFDITAMRTGKNGKYIIKPQIGESGADKEFKEVNAQGKPVDNEQSQSMGKPENAGRPEATVFNGVIKSIDTANNNMWIVTIDGLDKAVDTTDARINGEPAAGLDVTIKGELADSKIIAAKVEVR